MSSSSTISTSTPNRTRDYDLLYKLVLVGDTGVGKSCILLRLADDSFTESYITTIGVDFRFRVMTVDDKAIKLQIWDTAGQERFRTITSAYYRGADGIVLCYDCTERSSFTNIDDWISEVNRYASDNTAKILVGNKCDLESEKAVSTEEGKKKAEDLGIDFIETSAKNATNVEDAFITLARTLVKNRKDAALGATGNQQRNKTSSTRMRLSQQNESSTSSISNFFSSCCPFGQTS